METKGEEKEPIKLKVGDKVVRISRYGGSESFVIDEIERLTITQAITKKGARIKNEPKKHPFRDYYYYKKVGESVLGGYQILTHELLVRYNRSRLEERVKTQLYDLRGTSLAHASNELLNELTKTLKKLQKTEQS
ncbi:MAG: hypothetical protein HRU12_03990 [Phaeodactylibacter sp.]|nr:hypothetical protein [Phaeodactylibacter sp.]